MNKVETHRETNPPRGFRVRIILSWLIWLAGFVFFFVTRWYLAWLVALLADSIIRHLMRPPFPKATAREQVYLLVGVLLFVATVFLAPLELQYIISAILLGTLLIWVARSDYQLFVATGQPGTSGTCSDATRDA